MTTLKNNSEIRNFISNMNPSSDFFAVKSNKEIRVYENENDFDLDAEKNPNAVQGVFNCYNFHWYNF